MFKQARFLLQQERKWRRHVEWLIENNPQLAADGFDRVDPNGQEIMHEILSKDFKGLDTHRANNNNLPPEFRFFDSEAPLFEVAGDLGKVIMPRHLKLYKAIAA